MAGTGLSGQLSTAVESTYGTYVAPDRSFEILSESLDRNQVILQPQGLRAGTPNLRTGSKRSLVTHAAAGTVLPFTVLGAKIVDWELKINTSDYAQLKCGIDGRQMSTAQSLVSLGSAPYPVGAKAFAFSGAALSVGTIAAPSAGLAVSNQGAAGAVQYNYKVTSVNAQGESTPSSSVNTTTGNATLNGTNYNSIAWTAVSGATSYRVYGRPATSGGTYFYLGQVAASPYDDQNMVAGTTPPPTINTAGVPIASVTDCTVTGTMPMKTDRYYLGATGLKAEPVMNDYPTVGGTLTADFVSQADFYDRYVADSSAWLGLTFVGAALGSTGFTETLQ